MKQPKLRAQIEEMFSDNAGGISLIRVISFCWVINVTGIWLKDAIFMITLPDIPSGLPPLQRSS